MLQREGLHSSHLAEWHRLRDAAKKSALAPKKRGPKVAAPDPLAAKLAASERENARRCRS